MQCPNFRSVWFFVNKLIEKVMFKRPLWNDGFVFVSFINACEFLKIRNFNPVVAMTTVNNNKNLYRGLRME